MSKLMDLCFNITDGEHGTVIDDPKGNFFLLSNKNIVNGKVNIDPKLDRRINESTFNKINKRTKIETNDVLISTVGTIGKTSIVEKSVNFAVQRSVGIIKTNHQKLNPYYLKYQLMTSEFQNRLKLLSKGAVQKCLFIEDLKNLEVLCPSIETQNKVAHTLKILEDKISNNNKINAELESLAKTIYDYWFLQFEFPNEEGKPYKSSGGKMVWNEELKREIPEGWAYSLLKDKFSIKRGISYTSDDIKNNNGIPMLNLACIDTNRNYRDGELKFYSGKAKAEFLSSDDLIVASTDLTRNADIVGSPILVPQTGEKFIFSMDLVKLIPNEDIFDKYYLYMCLRTDFYHNYIKKWASGTNVLHLNLDGISWYKTWIPPKKIQNKFSNIIKKIHSKKGIILKENRELSSLREFLLPMLMNGQISFSEGK
ncbi:MAG: restriction endonuclease subunit S [Succinivibrio sp.]|nr:restriction endonuclease subunit S [Succinivibrio sp.]